MASIQPPNIVIKFFKMVFLSGWLLISLLIYLKILISKIMDV